MDGQLRKSNAVVGGFSVLLLVLLVEGRLYEDWRDLVLGILQVLVFDNEKTLDCFVVLDARDTFFDFRLLQSQSLNLNSTYHLFEYKLLTKC